MKYVANLVLMANGLISRRSLLVRGFVIPKQTTSHGPLRMVSQVGDNNDRSIEKVSPSMPTTTSTPSDQNRRNVVAGTTLALLSTPFLQDVPLGTFTSGAMAEVPETLLQGDVIVRSLWLNRLAYPVLIVGLEMGLFEALKDKALTKAELGQRMTPQLKGGGRAMEAIVAVLASLGLLEIRNDSTVSLTESARYVLLMDSPYFWGSQLLAADGITSALRRAFHTDGRRAPQDYAGHSAASIDSFIDSMQAHGAVTAKATGQALDSVIGKTAQFPAQHILDMAGGSGCFATALSDRYGVKVTLADLPAVVARWRHQHPFSQKVQAIPADLFESATWPRNGPDCHLMANVLHDWGESQIDAILQASYAVLKQSQSASANPHFLGRLVIIEQLLSDDRSGPLPAALASVSMLLGDWRTGKQYSFLELEAAAKRAGFSTVERGPKCGPFHTAVIAYV
jgi:3-hydroxy-5-methyl-1-naphthoate 3-O-methyltransferase